MTIRLGYSMLPDDRHERHGRLRDYFCDKDATAVRADGGWVLDLSWPSGPDRHVDGGIGERLADWGGIGLDGMAMARRRSGRVLTALYDTWTLPSWSEWARRVAHPPDAPLTVLHLDDHRDLMSPRLAHGSAGLVDMITGEPFDVRDPASVLSACESGAVGMGSFLTPFLLAFPHADVRQLCQPPKVAATYDWIIVPGSQRDDLLQPGADRPTIELMPAAGTGAGMYRATNDIDDWLADIGDGPILLHVDMDYFNNRFDGDGDWVDRMRRHDPDQETILRHIDEVTWSIRARGLIGRIEDAVVAFSPGFFPSEYWRVAETCIRSGLSELYG